MTMGQDYSAKTDARKGTVYSPPQLTFQMILTPEIREDLVDVSKGMFDPCCGHGQFPATEIVLRLFFNIDRLDEVTAFCALSTIYGMDVSAKSVDLCKAHMLDAFCDAFEFFTGREFKNFMIAAHVINRNFAVGDSLNNSAESRQQTLF